MAELPLLIRLDDLRDPRIASFLEEHLQDMRATSPPESVHALDLSRLRDPSVQFWSVWWARSNVADTGGPTLVGTGALKRLEGREAEIKSMRTAAHFRGRGIAGHLLRYIVQQARAQGLERISLETGTQAFFAPAHRLYLKEGFVPCGPFGSYTLDPNSRYLTMRL